LTGLGTGIDQAGRWRSDKDRGQLDTLTSGFQLVRLLAGFRTDAFRDLFAVNDVRRHGSLFYLFSAFMLNRVVS
jgi:hypothetical protein